METCNLAWRGMEEVLHRIRRSGYMTTKIQFPDKYPLVGGISCQNQQEVPLINDLQIWLETALDLGDPQPLSVGEDPPEYAETNRHPVVNFLEKLVQLANTVGSNADASRTKEIAELLVSKIQKKANLLKSDKDLIAELKKKLETNTPYEDLLDEATRNSNTELRAALIAEYVKA